MSKINTELLSDPIQTIPLKKFSFYKSRWRFLAISLVLILCGLAFSLIFGITLDIQFRGGSLLSYTISGDIDLLEAERVAESTLNLPVSVQQTTSIQAEGGKQVNALVISVAGNRALSNDQQLQLNDVLGKAFPESRPELLQSTLVDPFIGREVLFNGLLALGIASILIVLYVWIRFRTISGASAGVFSLLCLLHDVIISFFVFVAMRQPLDETVIAVVLSILGWSVNDTIVIFDRIRENEQLYGKDKTLPELVDLSIKQSLSRTIITSVCTFLAVFIAYIFAVVYNIKSIRIFALPLMVGIVVGSYSSICLATPFWAMWKIRRSKQAAD
ncbi:MAG: protein translocase subunit SecF [Clostridiaceae bacterium]|nr:protein translocase subunit SecF [Clostridiaceae bacterium]